MAFLFAVVAGAAEVHQVEIDLQDLGAAQVGVAKVSLADFIRGLEVAVAQVIGVEASARALGSGECAGAPTMPQRVEPA